MPITSRNLSLLQLAKLGVWLDDPYGDGFRLESIRKPSIGRLAAMALIRGEPILGGEDLIRDEYLLRVHSECFTASGHLKADVVRNCRL